ncbi:hypothetical protein llg_43650 [Luteolibacter sp. LG18]|nr:hypothetical protein llg_07210 [Luteolibacter sp. LG18]BCU79650.1 hypothetical protein llg_43650 [Luteolibacter sp. LG18]
MAHAGEAQSYEELHCDPEDHVPTECRDEKAFAVRLEGDSMEPEYKERDLLILMPERRIYTNCLAVLKLANDGVVFRRIEIRGDTIRLIPLNRRYEPDVIEKKDVTWAYPVYGMWRQITN